MAAGKKNATRLGAHLVFLDESGVLLIPTLRKTWAPRGKTPIVRHHYRRDRVSVISGVSVSPQRRHLGLYFHCYPHNIRHDEVCAFLAHLLRHLRGHVIVLWDNASIHKGARIRALCGRFPRLHLEAFPPYAPDLNPDEEVWAYTKGQLANGRPDDLRALLRTIQRALRGLQRSQRCLRWCVRNSKLPPLLP